MHVNGRFALLVVPCATYGMVIRPFRQQHNNLDALSSWVIKDTLNRHRTWFSTSNARTEYTKSLYVICGPKLWWSKKIHLLAQLCLGFLGFFHFRLSFDTYNDSTILIRNTAVFAVFMFILCWMIISESAKCKSDMEQYIHKKISF